MPTFYSDTARPDHIDKENHRQRIYNEIAQDDPTAGDTAPDVEGATVPAAGVDVATEEAPDTDSNVGVTNSSTGGMPDISGLLMAVIGISLAIVVGVFD